MLELMTGQHRSGTLGSGAPLPTLGSLLAGVLDEVDIGILLLSEDGSVLHLNHRARHALAARQGLVLAGTALRADEPITQACLQKALHDAARRGLRRLLELGRGEGRHLAALVPVQPGVAALLLGRSSVCEDLSMQCFARQHSLTPAETRVLAALGRGVTPSEIARMQGVKISTVRTQISAIRQKTGAATINALVRLVAGLPPMLGVLRS